LNVLKLVDLALMVGSFLLTTLLILRESNAMTFSDFLSMRIKIGNFVLFFVLLVLWHIVFSAFGLYDSRRMSGRTADAIDAFKAAMVGTSLLTVASLAFPIRMISPSFLLVFWSISTGIAVVQRVLLRSVLERIRLKGRNLRHMLIVGTNSRALDFASMIKARPELG